MFVHTQPTQRSISRQFAALTSAQGYAPPSTNPFDRLTDLDAELSATSSVGWLALRVNSDLGPGTLPSWRYWNWVPANDRHYKGPADRHPLATAFSRSEHIPVRCGSTEPDV